MTKQVETLQAIIKKIYNHMETKTLNQDEWLDYLTVLIGLGLLSPVNPTKEQLVEKEKKKVNLIK